VDLVMSNLCLIKVHMLDLNRDGVVFVLCYVMTKFDTLIACRGYVHLCVYCRL
jgi:hypothetical protein